MHFEVQKFMSIKEFADEAMAGAKRFEQETQTKGASRKRGEWSSDHATSLRKAYDFAVKGFDVGLMELNSTISNVAPRVREIVQEHDEYVPAVSGPIFDIGAFLAGEPDYCFDIVYEESARRTNVVTVLVGTAASAGVSAYTISRRGALVAVLIEALAIKGFEMEVWAETAIKRGDKGSSMLVRAKAAGDPIDLRSYAFITDAGWLRRLGFGVMEGWAAEKRGFYGVSTHGSYGSPADAQHGKLVGANLILNIGNETGWPSYRHCGSPEERIEEDVAWVTRTLENLESQTLVS